MKLPGVRAGMVFPVLIFFITAVIGFINYQPGTWLTGWDTLHPEFNFPAQLSQLFFGVWRADQGLGAVAAHSHMAELPRVLLLWLGSWVLPLSDLRYAYVLICFILGPLGVYFFLKSYISRPAAFLGSLFYVFNLGTVQHFYVPFEMFPTQYAVLGWLFLFASHGNLLLFSLTTILALPMSYASLLWYAYFVALITFVLVLRPRHGLALIMITLIINSFWLLPNWYFMLTHAKDVPLAKTNQMFSETAFLKNKEFGNLADVAIFKNFLFDWQQNTAGGGSEDLMSAWKAHLSSVWITAIGYLAALLSAVGAIVSFKQRKRIFLAILPMAALALVMLLNIFEPLQGLSPVLKESLRFPYTKFSLLLMFAMSCFFAVFWEQVLARTKRFWLIVLVVSLGLIIYGWPMFRGFLIDPAMKLSIPQEYFQAFEWLNHQPSNARIAPFPVDSSAGWQYASWGYQGAGFFWFGVRQSFLARDFDRWMPTNENYYWEISQALYSKNLPLLENVLDKYRVNYLLIDENIVNPSSPKALYFDELKELISNSEKIKPETNFGKISVYSFELEAPTKSFVSLAQNLPGSGSFHNVKDLMAGAQLAQYRGRLVAKGNETRTYPELPQRNGYIIKVVSKNIAGRPLLFWVEDLNSRHAAIEHYLNDEVSYFYLPPADPYGLGYTVHVDNISIGKQRVENYLESFEIYETNYHVGADPRVRPTIFLNNFVVEHLNPALYRVDVNGPGTLVLAQSFEPGWIAIGARDHVLIDNWANGWMVEEGPRVVYLFFWPQLLEFAGFGLCAILILWLKLRSP